MNEESDGAPGLVADRYELGEIIGTGGTSQVHVARDTVTDATVAVKLLSPIGPFATSPRVRREVAALRLLRIPGVVTLLDSGAHDGAPYLVMDLVDGAPFPGLGTSREWDALAPLVISLGETLARIHAAGVVHRDLKPSNVLVGEDGRVTVLDFGLSWGPALGASVTTIGTVIGTPEYLSPEQIAGGRADVRSDLYSLGVMLYELFAGALPHRASDFARLAELKRGRVPPPLRRLCPGVPRSVGDVIDKLLAIDPDDRPQSAGETLSLLFGHVPASMFQRSLPRLGGAAVLQEALDAARSGRSLDVTGSRGSGRTRLLDDIEAALISDGADVRWLVPGATPYASLDKLLGGFDDLAESSSDDAVAAISQRLATLLAAGTVLLVDDAERIDRWSERVLDGARTAGALIRVVDHGTDDAVVLAGLTEEDLRPLFAGPDRIFHLREDGAEELWRRTAGLPARIASEIAAWVRAGLARWEDDEVRIDRDALNRLRGGLPVGNELLLSHGTRGNRSLEMDEMLSWIAIAWPNTEIDVLTAATAHPRWLLEPEIEALIEQGLVRETADGRIQPLVVPFGLQCWVKDKRRDAHRALSKALAPGAPDRLRHLAAAGEPHEVVAEAMLAAEALTKGGRTGDALVALDQGLTAARAAEDTDAEESILRSMAINAMEEGTPTSLSGALYEFSRTGVESTRTRRIGQLLSAARDAVSGLPDAALESLRELGPFADPGLELWRQGQRVSAARFVSVEREGEILDRLEQWAAGFGSRRASDNVIQWKALHLYRSGAFEEAAALNRELHESSEHQSWSLSFNAGLSLLEAHRLDEAESAAGLARDLGASTRSAVAEAYAELLLRAIRYRKGSAMDADTEFADAVMAIGDPVLSGNALAVEAAIAWRSDDRATGRRFAGIACSHFSASRDSAQAMAARALELLCGAEPDEGEMERLIGAARECSDRSSAVQTLGMLAEAFPSHAARLRRLVQEGAGEPEEAQLDRRGSVLSLREIRTGVGRG